MPIQVYKPACQVMLEKAVAHEERQYGTIGKKVGDQIDLTAYLGDSGSVSTHKSMLNPVGRFEIALPDKPLSSADGQIDDSLYGIAEPMDRIVIRMARNRHEYTDALPIIMRGFVREVSREERMGPQGPQRMVVISGDDYGCILEMITFNFWFGSVMGADSNVTPIMRAASVGLSNAYEPVGDYMKKLVKASANEYFIQPLRAGGGKFLLDIQVDSTVTRGNVAVNQAISPDGSLWNKLRQFADSPWNELFLEDRWDKDAPDDVTKSAPFLVFRPTPFIALNANLTNDDDIMFIDNMGEELKPTGDKRACNIVRDVFDFVQAATYTRSDNNVSNIFVVPTFGTGLTDSKNLAQSFLTKTDGNMLDAKVCSKTLYSVRPLEVKTVLAPSDGKHSLNLQKAEIVINENKAVVWQNQRRDWLVAANWTNVLWEHGTLRVRGNEKLRIGSLYILSRGQFKDFAHYITQVSHQYTPYQSFTTAIEFVRSNNYFKRLAQDKAPVLLEGHKGAYG